MYEREIVTSLGTGDVTWAALEGAAVGPQDGEVSLAGPTLGNHEAELVLDRSVSHTLESPDKLKPTWSTRGAVRTTWRLSGSQRGLRN